MIMKKFALISAIGFLAASAFAAQGAPVGASVDPTPEEQKALDALKEVLLSDRYKKIVIG